VLTKISVTIAAGGIVFETLMGVNFWTGALIVVIATGVYTPESIGRRNSWFVLLS
jgi:SSS family solute:Na+ symporter